MSKLGDAFKDGRIVGGVIAVGLLAVVGTGVGAVALSGANAEQAPAAVVETVEPIDFASLPYTNGLAGEQEADAAAAVAAEQARVSAEAEAARVAAEQAAAAEAQRVAAEQAVADEPTDEPVADDPWASKIRVPWIPSPDPENAAGGDWDMSVCNGGSASTGPDGVPYCD